MRASEVAFPRWRCHNTSDLQATPAACPWTRRGMTTHSTWSHATCWRPPWISSGASAEPRRLPGCSSPGDSPGIAAAAWMLGRQVAARFEKPRLALRHRGNHGSRTPADPQSSPAWPTAKLAAHASADKQHLARRPISKSTVAACVGAAPVHKALATTLADRMKQCGIAPAPAAAKHGHRS